MELEGKEFFTTRELAVLLRRAEQTLRFWAMSGTGPIAPIHTRRGAPLLWRRADIERWLLSEAAAAAIDTTSQGIAP